MTSFRASAAACKRSGASAADNNPAPSVKAAINLSFIDVPPMLHLQAYQSGLVPFHHAGHFCLADAVDPADNPADLGGHALRGFLLVQIELDF